MSHHRYFYANLYFVLFWAFSISAVNAANPIDVGTHKQLFVDNKFIASSEGIELTMNSPAKAAQPVLASDMPWGDEEKAGIGLSRILKATKKIVG